MGGTAAAPCIHNPKDMPTATTMPLASDVLAVPLRPRVSHLADGTKPFDRPPRGQYDAHQHATAKRDYKKPHGLPLTCRTSCSFTRTTTAQPWVAMSHGRTDINRVSFCQVCSMNLRELCKRAHASD